MRSAFEEVLTLGHFLPAARSDLLRTFAPGRKHSVLVRLRASVMRYKAEKLPWLYQWALTTPTKHSQPAPGSLPKTCVSDKLYIYAPVICNGDKVLSFGVHLRFARTVSNSVFDSRMI